MQGDHLSIKILMVMHSSSLTGPNKATVSLLEAIDRNSYEVDVASPAAGYLVGRLKNIGIRHIPLEFGRYSDLATLLRLIFILLKGRYHIIHGHMGRVAPMICIAGRIARVPAVIFTEHMNTGSHTWIGRDPFKLFLHRLFHGISNNCLDLVIAVSETARKNYILRQGIREEKTATIYNGISFGDKNGPDRTALRERLGATDKDTMIIGMFGRLVREKGYADVMSAGEEILKHNDNVLFLAVGDGPERQDLERLAGRGNLAGKVVFMGFRTDATDIMEAVDILVQPSWTESAESFGLVLIEAMSLRKSVVASDIAPFIEIIEDGHSGLLFPEKNYRILAKKIKLLIDDRALMEKMGRRGYEIAKERFDIKIIARKTEDKYREVLLLKGYGWRAI